MMPCSVDGCGQPAKHRGWCWKHYDRWRRHGSPHILLTNQGRPVEERFFALTQRDEESGCLIWQGSVRRDGYGYFYVHGKMRSAHRVAWWISKGEWPEGPLDHCCHNNDTTCPGGVCVHRRCVEVGHLEQVSQSENVLRARRARYGDSCARGHPWTAENTYIRQNGKRQGKRECVTCRRNREGNGSEPAGPAVINAAKTHCIRGHPLTPDNIYPSQLPRRQCVQCARSAQQRRKQPRVS